MEDTREQERLIDHAIIISVEMHPKQSHMYQVAIQLNGGGPVDEEPDSDVVLLDEEPDADIVLLAVHEDTLVSMRLLKDRRLSAEEYVQLKAEQAREDAYRVALNMIERKPRTTAELATALRRKGYVQEAIEGCLTRLQHNGLLDDAGYARRFAEQRATNQRKGRMLIRQELLQRGVGRSDAEEAVSAIDADVERQAALALARKRWPQTKGSDYERRMKLIGMLLRRGYSQSIAREAVGYVLAEQSIGVDSDGEFEESLGEFGDSEV